ncbi:MAG: orotidine-5'-phosphate decarboxylase [Candidatus Omnitrophota bacterium]|nr:orotidine-5'-phosphate decarboxylase [Candidatus Omnitrophota bacterium]
MRLTTDNRQLATELILALDVDSFSRAKYFVDLLYPQVRIFKVGLQLFIARGDKIIKYIKKKGAGVFLDLKFHDIPNTVGNAARAVVRLGGVKMFTVHTQGGLAMLQAARKAVTEEAFKLGIKPPLIIGVTVLTSAQKTSRILALVLKRAYLARQAALDGVVCSVKEAGAVRKKLGKDFIIVTPGIRLPEDKQQDQKRVATPREAKRAGSNYIVIGRPILSASNPKEAVRIIKEQI